MFTVNKARVYGWKCIDTEVYHSDKNGKDYWSVVFLDKEGYRKVCRLADGIDPAEVEHAKGQTFDVCISCIARKEYSFLVFEGFFAPEKVA